MMQVYAQDVIVRCLPPQRAAHRPDGWIDLRLQLGRDASAQFRCRIDVAGKIDDTDRHWLWIVYDLCQIAYTSNKRRSKRFMARGKLIDHRLESRRIEATTKPEEKGTVQHAGVPAI